MTIHILLVSGAPGAAGCASEMARRLGGSVDLVGTRRAALQAVKRRDYHLLVLEEALAEADAGQAAALLQAAGDAYPVQLNFAVTGIDRAVREVRSAIQRRQRETAQARAAAARALEAEINSHLTGMLLELDFVAASRRVPQEEAVHLARVLSLTHEMRRKLSTAAIAAGPERSALPRKHSSTCRCARESLYSSHRLIAEAQA